MKNIPNIFFLTLILAFGFHDANAAERPNVILIMVDDMGFSDLGYHGGEIDTPNLDALAKGGVRFSQFYNSGRCCPTRATLMTGLHPHEVGIGHMTQPPGSNRGEGRPPAYQGYLNRSCITIAEALGVTTRNSDGRQVAFGQQRQGPLAPATGIREILWLHFRATGSFIHQSA